MSLTKSSDTKRLNDLRRAVDTACIISVTDARGHILFVNDNFCRVSGYTFGELIGERHNLFKTDYHSADFYRHLWDTITSGKPFRTEFKDRTKDGSIFWVDTTIIPFLNNKGVPFQYIGISRDITNLKTLEASLRESRETLQLFIEHAPASIAMLDLQLKYLVVSNRWLRDYHSQGEDIIGRPFFEFFLNHADAWKEHFRRALAGESVSGDEVKFRISNGRVRWMRWEIRPWHKAADEIGGAIIFTEDITDHKQVEEEMRLIPRKILQAQEAERSRIAWDIHDDLGQSLICAKMLVTAHMQEAVTQNLGCQKFGAEILEQLDACLEKTRRVSYGLLPPQLRLLGVGEAVKEMIKNINQRYVGVTVQVDSQDLGPVRFRGDDINIYRIVQEALNNVLKHAKATTVVISMKCRNGKFYLMVKDNGVGFDNKARKRPADVLRRGIGLNVMRERVKLLGGRLSVDTGPGKGTVVKVCVPVENQGNDCT
ncbi:MAG: PAS domain S-box protein [Candidatus Omnitrophica bacterium]|nr:PAS domain S-box protein [Candidatus Omnitrophota bacterium]MCB9719959.1 PAS domain S-box protein [Candidatus Omnitrophota bacterium]